jgi:hypothetical protein
MAKHIERLHDMLARVDDQVLAVSEARPGVVPDTVMAAISTRLAAKALVRLPQSKKEVLIAPAGSDGGTSSSPGSSESWEAAHPAIDGPRRVVPLPWNCVTDPSSNWSSVILMEVDNAVELLGHLAADNTTE